MTNWKEMHSDFTPELQKEWEDNGFNYEECKEWVDIGMKINDSDFCAWLRDKRKISVGKFLNCNTEKLKKDYTKDKDYPTSSRIIQEVKNNPKNWRIDEVITEYDNFGEVVKKELALIHKSTQIGHKGEVFGSIGHSEDTFSWYPVHLLSQNFNQNEIMEIKQFLNNSNMEVKFDIKTVYKNK